MQAGFTQLHSELASSTALTALSHCTFYAAVNVPELDFHPHFFFFSTLEHTHVHDRA